MYTARRIGAILISLTLLVGLPWLATTLPWPVLDHPLTTWEVYLRSARLPPGVGTAALIVALWGVWGLYVAVLSTEVLGHLRQSPLASWGPLRPLQLLAATSLGTLTIAPSVAYAAPAAVATAETLDAAEAEPEQIEGNPTEPFVVERSAVVDSFGYDSADLTPGMIEDLEATADLITGHGAPELPIVVTGHTDAAGDSDYNRDLSERRAEAVAEVLRTHLGEDLVVESHGEGDTALLDEVDDDAQRRVDISYSVVVTPPPADPSTGENAEEGEAGQQEEGVEEHTPVGLSLPGGLILAMTAGTAGVVGGMVLERRHGLPATATEGAGQAPEREDREHPVEAAPTPAAAGIGEKDHPTLALIDLARAPGFGITGPGAEGAVRTLLVRALGENEDELTVVVPESDLRGLLDDAGRLPVLSEDAPVMVTETVTDALTLLQLQVLALHRAADEVADAAEDPPTEDEPVGPQFVLLARASVEITEEVSSLLAHVEGAPLSAVLLGPWPTGGGPTLTLDENGIITQADDRIGELSGYRWAPTPLPTLQRSLAAHREAPAAPPRQKKTPPQDQEADQGQDQEKPPPGERPSEPTSSGALPTEDSDTAADTTQGTVSVTVLGPITLAAHGYQVRPHRRAAYEVLAYLAAHPQGVRLETAVDEMWPQEAPHRAIRRFHDACTAVRSACRPHLGEAATAIITHDQERYRLNAAMVGCDLWQMDRLLQEASHSDTPEVLATSAAAMLDGDFADQTDFSWAEAARVRIRTRIVESLTDHSASVDTRQAISMLQRALRIEPVHDGAARELSRRYAENGDTETADHVMRNRRELLENVE